MNTLVIAVIAGTTRPLRQSIFAAEYVAEIGRTLPNVEIVWVDPMDFTFNGDGNDPEGKDPRYTAITERADAFFIVTPEYNNSFPGSLKRLLDSELKTYIHKPVAIAGSSSGHWGGVRAIEALVGVVRELGLVATFSELDFPRVESLFEDGKLKQEFVERYEKATRAAYDELIWMANALKVARDKTA
jgi:NAD(P)H-dependent FMN reductase